MASAVGRVGPVPEPAAAKACRLGEVEGVPEKRGCEADGGETHAPHKSPNTRRRGCRSPVSQHLPQDRRRGGRDRPRLHRDEAVKELGHGAHRDRRGSREIAEARACQPCRQSAELLHRDRVAHTGRQWKGKGETGGACAPQNEPATADGRHPVVPSRKCPTHYASHPHRRQQKGRGMTAPESAAIASP